MKNTLSSLLAILTIALCSQTRAGSATWNLNPTNNLWNTSENWSPATVPNSETDVATFGVSNITDIVVGMSTDFDGAENKVSEIVFKPGASAYTLISTPSDGQAYSDYLEFYGGGIVNNSGKNQHFIVKAAPGPEEAQAGVIYFQNSSSVADNVIITNEGSGSSIGIGVYGGVTNLGFNFTDNPSAGKATYINEGGKVAGTLDGGVTALFSYSTAVAAIFINQPGEVDGAAAGLTFVDTYGNVGRSTFVNNAASMIGAEGGYTEIDRGICEGARFIAKGASSAGPQGGQVYTYGGEGYASFTAKGGQGSGAQGGLIEIQNICNSGQTVVSAEAGRDGGLGGMITLTGKPVTLDQVQFRLQGNATMALSVLVTRSATIGSLSGKGAVSLGGFLLTIGGNSLDTTFSGVIQDNGGINKLGSGTLTLSGANTYSRSTTISAGALVVANKTGSGTGAGPVTVEAGILGGSGIVAGKVKVGTGSGAGAFLAPAAAANKPGTLTIQRSLNFNSDATYTYIFEARRNKVRADQVIANGVTINNATFSLSGTIQGKMRAGTMLTLISNTKATPINGVFNNLADGAIVTVNGNHLKASYTGGDGNDLTLTVVP